MVALNDNKANNSVTCETVWRTEEVETSYGAPIKGETMSDQEAYRLVTYLQELQRENMTLQAELSAGEAQNKDLWALYNQQAKELSAAQLTIEKMRESLKECAEDMADWGLYASDYFQEKYGLKNDIAKYDKMLDELKKGV